MITDTNQHKENLIKIPKSLRNLNRYAEILPYYYNNVLINNDPDNLDDNYINASFIAVHTLYKLGP